jgi:hypothetical protein
LAFFAITSCLTVYAAVQFQGFITATGKIVAVNLGIYSDQACTTVLSTIDWGSLTPGQTKTVTCYLKSTSTVNSTLSMSTGSWNPSSTSSYITLSWNREAYKIKPSEIVSATLTLTVSPSITGISSFSFTITITATEA